MKKMHLFLLTLAVSLGMATAMQAQSADNDYPGTTSTWNGGVRHDFKFMGRDAIVVEPVGDAAPGRPWIFRPAFFDAFAWADAALLHKGFHVVYCDFTHEFACPASMEQGDAFYRFATGRLRLSPKVTLEGLSRGAYWCFNWAARHPERVACLYVDAPLCHMISNADSDNDEFFQSFLQKWGMEKGTVVTEDFQANVKPLMLSLLKGRVPILGVCGDSDRVVPYEENLKPLSEQYRAQGGEIEVIVKPGCDHHPHSLEQPAPIVNFILAHTLAPANALQAIMQRASVRSYRQDRPVAPEVVEQLLRAGMAAPSCVNRQPWELLVLTTDEAKARAVRGLGGNDFVATAPVVIIPCVNMQQVFNGDTYNWMADLSAVSENILVAAQALGLGGCWVGGWPNDSRVGGLRREFSLPEHIVPVSVLPIGYPEEQPQPKDKWNPEKVHYNSFQ